MTRWSIPALRCDRCGAEVEERNEAKPVAKEWGVVTALAPSPEGRARQIGDGTNPADLCTACIDGLFHWYVDLGAPQAPPRPLPPVVQRVRLTLTLDDLSAIGVIIAKAIAAQTTSAIEMLREQPSAMLMEPSDPNFPPVMESLAFISSRAAREIADRFHLLNAEIASGAPLPKKRKTAKEKALDKLIAAATSGVSETDQAAALAAYETIQE